MMDVYTASKVLALFVYLSRRPLMSFTTCDMYMFLVLHTKHIVFTSRYIPTPEKI